MIWMIRTRRITCRPRTTLGKLSSSCTRLSQLWISSYRFRSGTRTSRRVQSRFKLRRCQHQLAVSRLKLSLTATLVTVAIYSSLSGSSCLRVSSSRCTSRSLRRSSVEGLSGIRSWWTQASSATRTQTTRSRLTYSDRSSVVTTSFWQRTTPP